MASSITKSFGKQASARTLAVEAVVDFTAITSYVAGGHEDAVLSAALEGADFFSIPRAHYDGSATRYFKVDPATKKVQSFTDATCQTETSPGADLSGHTAIPVQIIGE